MGGLKKPNKVTYMEKLKIENAEVVFASLTDTGFGTSLTIKVTPEIEKALTDFYAKNKIGNEKTVIGVPNFKDYEGTKQINLKINESTKFAGLNGLTTESLGFGARVNFFLNAFEYNNKFTKGKTYVGASISAVVILSCRKTGADADLAELLAEAPAPISTSEEVKSDLPF